MYKTLSFLTLPVATFLLLAGCSSKPLATEAPKDATPKAEATTPAPEPTAEPTHAVAGVIEEVAPDGSYIVVKSSDATLTKLETTPDTNVVTKKHGVEESAKGLGQDVKKGTMVAVRYTEKEGKLIGHEIQHATEKVVKETVVVVHKIEKGGEKVWVKTRNGAEEVYHVGKHATVASGKKIAEVGKLTGEKIVAGTKATVHFTEEAGKKTIHFVQQK